MLHFWGVALYGEWLMLIAIPAYLGISDFGFGSVTARHMTMLVGAGKKTEALGSFQSSHLLITVSSLVVATLLVCGVWGLELFGLLSFHRIVPESVVVVMLIYSAKMMIGVQAGLCLAGLQCEGKYPLGLLLVALTDLMEFLCIAIAVASGATPIGAAAAAWGGVAVGALALRIALWREVPWISFGWAKANLEHIRELWRPALSAMMFPLGQALSYQGPRLAIGALVGPAAVAAFVAHRQLVRFGTLALAMGAPIEAELAMQFGRDSGEAYRQHAFRATEVLIWMSTLALVFASTAGLRLFGVWTSGRLEVNYSLLLLLGAVTLSEASWRSVLVPMGAVNRHMRVAFGYLLASVFVLVPSLYVMTSMHGVTGAALALLFAEMAMLIWTARESMRLLAVGPATWLVGSFSPPIWILREGRNLLARRRDAPSSE